MPHFFDNAPLWTAVGPDLPLEPFLAAGEGLAKIFDALGALTLAPVKADFLKNLTQLRAAATKLAAAGTPVRTLPELLQAERTAGRTRGECALTSYLWLHRGFRMVDLAFNRWATTKDELKVCFSEAYKVTLYKHHTWIQYGAFQLALNSIPTRAYLDARLGHPPLETVRAYFSALHAVLARLPVPTA